MEEAFGDACGTGVTILFQLGWSESFFICIRILLRIASFISGMEFF